MQHFKYRAKAWAKLTLTMAHTQSMVQQLKYNHSAALQLRQCHITSGETGPTVVYSLLISYYLLHTIKSDQSDSCFLQVV